MSVKDADIDEFNSLNRGVVPKFVGRMVMGLYFSCVGIDIVFLTGMATNPDGIGRYVCATRSFGAIAWPLFSEDLLRYSADQCLGTMDEPAISIILLSIKYTIGILIVPIICCVVLCRPRGLLTLIEATFLRAETSGAYYREFRRWGRRLIVLGVLDFAGIHLSSAAKLADFNESIFHKLSLEDGFVILIPASIFYCLVFLVAVGLSRARRTD
jgi:hypothetical protein